jgi:hypothetical protein
MRTERPVAESAWQGKQEFSRLSRWVHDKRPRTGHHVYIHFIQFCQNYFVLTIQRSTNFCGVRLNATFENNSAGVNKSTLILLSPFLSLSSTMPLFSGIEEGWSDKRLYRCVKCEPRWLLLLPSEDERNQCSLRSLGRKQRYLPLSVLVSEPSELFYSDVWTAFVPDRPPKPIHDSMRLRSTLTGVVNALNVRLRLVSRECHKRKIGSCFSDYIYNV